MIKVLFQRQQNILAMAKQSSGGKKQLNNDTFYSSCSIYWRLDKIPKKMWAYREWREMKTLKGLSESYIARFLTSSLYWNIGLHCTPFTHGCLFLNYLYLLDILMPQNGSSKLWRATLGLACRNCVAFGDFTRFNCVLILVHGMWVSPIHLMKKRNTVYSWISWSVITASVKTVGTFWMWVMGERFLFTANNLLIVSHLFVC